MYASPSDAASAIVGKRTNGWAFFLIDQVSRDSLRTVRRKYVETMAVDAEDASLMMMETRTRVRLLVLPLETGWDGEPWGVVPHGNGRYMNHLEQLVAEWLQYNGYFARVSPLRPGMARTRARVLLQ
jgi:hypothetical protein